MNHIRALAINSLSASIVHTHGSQYRSIARAGFSANSSISSNSRNSTQDYLRQMKRDMGWWSSMTETVSGKLQERQQRNVENKMKDQEKVYLEKLATITEPLTLSHYKTIFIDVAKSAGYDSWKSKIPIPGQKEQMEEIKVRMAILEALNEEELKKTAFDIETLNRIRVVTTLPPSKVKLVMKEFKNTKLLHEFFMARRKKGLPTPTSREEAAEMIKKDPPKDMISRKPIVSINDIKSVYSGSGNRRTKY